ncbi:MAG TPA: ABC transporter permease [Streptosporangiaceae bacterium]|nr:ABC transporter permease [Streptosporangiaceae bacterium]
MRTYRIGWGGYLAAGLVAVFFVLPLIIIAISAFDNSNLLGFPPTGYSLRWARVLLTSPDWTNSMQTSLRVGLTAAGLSLVLGVPLGLALGRGRIGRSRAVQALVLAPVIMPVVTLALGYFFLSADTHLLNTILPLIIAHTTLGLPLVVIAVLATVRGIDASLEPAARTLGASPWRTFRSITVPLLLPGIVAGAVFAFLASWDDIVNVVFLGTATIRTFPLQLWTQMQYNLTPIVATAAIFLSMVGIGLVSITGLIFWARRRRISGQVAENILLRRGV